MEKKEITIIIPTYNNAAIIEVCLKSIREQTYSNFKVFIVDDGSTDNTKEVCQNYCDYDIRFKYYNQKNKGVSAARNFGIDNCDSEFITFIDADDYVDKNHLQCLVTSFDMDIELSACGLIYEDGKQSEMKSSSKEKLYYSKSTVEASFERFGMQGIVTNKLFKFEIIKKNNIRFSEDIKKFEDHLFCIEYMLHVNQSFYTGKLTYHYVKHQNSALQKSVGINITEDMRAYNRLDQYDLSQQVISLIGITKNNIAINVFVNSIDKDNKRDAFNYLKMNYKFKDLLSSYSLKNFLKKTTIYLLIKTSLVSN